MSLRAWQQEALDKYSATAPQDFLAVATPGAGKTSFALTVAQKLIHDREVERIIVVVPTEHLKKQWADSAKEFGLSLDWEFSNTGALNPHYDGIVITYAQVGMSPARHHSIASNTRSLVIMDEIHHAGDAKSWGAGVQEAFSHAQRRLALTGTPFRSDDSAIPFVRYTPVPGGHFVSDADYTYSYTDALTDGVVRPVVFMAYSGHTRWRTSAGEEFEARLGEPLTPEQNARAWRTALDPEGEWIQSVLRAAHIRLTKLRENVPDAGGLVIATDKASARAYAKILETISGHPVTVVLSDDPSASENIEKFSQGSDEWMVAVRMVSEGVDVPRLAVGVYATNASTPLFFAQAIGRFVRSRRPGESANIFIPSIPVLLELASELERQRNHVLGKPDGVKAGFDDELLVQANALDTELDEAESFESLVAQAELSSFILDGSQYGAGSLAGSAEEEDFLGLPGLLAPEQMKELLRSREQEAQSIRKNPHSEDQTREIDNEETNVQSHRGAGDIPSLRKKLNALVSIESSRSGRPHGMIHNELRRKTNGQAIALCSADELSERIRILKSW